MAESIILEHGGGLEILAPDLSMICIETARHYEDLCSHGWIFEGVIPIDKEDFVKGMGEKIKKSNGLELFVGPAYYYDFLIRDLRALLYRVCEN